MTKQEKMAEFLIALQVHTQKALTPHLMGKSAEAYKLGIGTGDIGYSLGASLASVFFEITRGTATTIENPEEYMHILEDFCDGFCEKIEILSDPEKLSQIKTETIEVDAPKTLH